MTGRDRLVVIVLGSLAMLAAVYLLVVSPERKQASSLTSQVSTATAQLSTAESQLASARADQSRYSAAYASVVRLGKAVPASEEVPSLIYQLAQVSNGEHVDFSSISTGSSGSSGAAAPAAGSPAAVVASAGFTQMPFTFVFNGSFDDLYRLFKQMDAFTTRTTSGGVQVSGRLLTIQGAKLSPLTTTSVAGAKATEQLTGTVTATAYVLPASESVTGGATAASPTAASTTPAAGSASSASAPAIARVTP